MDLNMIERINLLLKAKNITAKQFAEEIGIQPSGMSHIMSGRNNPSLDFVMKVVNRWPEVNINWLMLGKGEMYAGVPLNVQEPSVPADSVHTEPVNSYTGDPEQFDLFSSSEEAAYQGYRNSETSDNNESQPANTRTVQPEMPTVRPDGNVTDASTVRSMPEAHERENAEVVQSTENVTDTKQTTSEVVQTNQKTKKIVKVVLLYDDHSFAEYYPE